MKKLKAGTYTDSFARNTKEVTYREFAQLARRQRWSAAFLAERFLGKIEQPRAFFERVLASSANGGELGGSVIPYRSVLEFYRSKSAAVVPGGKARGCQCGCGKPVYGRKKMATAACRKRMERQRSLTPERGSGKHKKDGVFSVTF